MAGTDSTDPSGRFDLERAKDSSHILALLRRASHPLTSTARWFTDATKRSFLYRWLTKEPEPEVVVVDLRDTYTVAPVIALLDRVVDALAPSWRTSVLRRTTSSLVSLLEAAADTKIGRTIAKRFEPPAPPEDRDERG